jgi:hypothetical protein
VRHGNSSELPYLWHSGRRDSMDRFWEAEPGWLVLELALLAVMVTVARYVIGKICPKTVQKEQHASAWLSKCRESHSRGELSDEEFRTIKTNLGAQLQDELNDNEEIG